MDSIYAHWLPEWETNQLENRMADNNDEPVSPTRKASTQGIFPESRRGTQQADAENARGAEFPVPSITTGPTPPNAVPGGGTYFYGVPASNQVHAIPAGPPGQVYGYYAPGQVHPLPSQFMQPPNFQGLVPLSQKIGGVGTTGLGTVLRTIRRNVELDHGHLVIELPVPNSLLKLGQYTNDIEFTHTRYTAVTCSADDFSSKGYQLRQQRAGRHTELFIVVTMYNEGDDLFCKTMLALMKNIAYLCSRTRSKMWGEMGWQKAVICIVSDGRSKINPRVMSVLGLMGVFQDGIMKNSVNGQDVTAHLFEYTTQIAIDGESMEINGPKQGIVPCQILFCLKEKNAKKINSHRWFFNAFGPLLNPNVCILIDVGTKPTDTSLYHLWKAFDINKNVGGACGEIYAEVGSGCFKLINPLVASQNFEYKMSNILDKPLESSFGYISVLPGAFSAYRYAALQGTPLQQYFKGETMHGGENIFAANMYLAEDRILCFELITKAKEAWVLRYIKAARAETDVPDTVPEFISQRRRWLNGSFFATIHALSHWYLIFRSGHNILQKFLFCVEFLYNAVSLLFNWTGIGNFYLTFYFLMATPMTITLHGKTFSALGSSPDASYGTIVNQFQIYSTVLHDAYLIAMAIIFICSLGNRPQGSKIMYTLCMVMFAVIMGIMLYLGIFQVYAIVQQTLQQLTDPNFMNSHPEFRDKNTALILLQYFPMFRDTVCSLGATYGMYLVSSFLYFEPWHMFTSFLQYLLLLPSYVNILNVYAFCNLHDVSWGTKGDNTTNADLGLVKAVQKDGKDIVEVEVTDQNDANAAYGKYISELKQERPKEVKKRDAKTKQEDYFRKFRTNVILAWLFTNGLLIGVLTTDWLQAYIFSAFNFNAGGGNTISSNSGTNPYLKFIFYANLGLASVRFLGCLVYLVLNMVHKFF
ncbi:chitin synthase-domain-containing protein [Chytriomyces sp. MP71]|nr:chitin synthase-domain-containing protein [Chytriomyces sp. MP71]